MIESIDNQRSIGFENSLIDQLCNICIMIMIKLSSTEVVRNMITLLSTAKNPNRRRKKTSEET